ncbi:ECF transporter S component [Gracilinema caldarium]|nr:ECF transporter S component [Gracilinema caldarium]
MSHQLFPTAIIFAQTGMYRKGASMAGNNKLFSWKLNEVVVLVVLSIAIGVLFWAWTFIAALAKPLSAIGLDYLLAGVWFIGGTLVAFIIRRPGAALLGEVLAAILEGFITQWGITAAIWGLVQGLGAEVVFAATRYKKWNLPTMLLAALVSSIFSYVLDFFYSQYWTLQAWIWPIQIVSVSVGGLFWAGWLAYRIGRGIIRTGVASNLRCADDLVRDEQAGDRE